MCLHLRMLAAHCARLFSKSQERKFALLVIACAFLPPVSALSQEQPEIQGIYIDSPGRYFDVKQEAQRIISTREEAYPCPTTPEVITREFDVKLTKGLEFKGKIWVCRYGEKPEGVVKIDFWGQVDSNGDRITGKYKDPITGAAGTVTYKSLGPCGAETRKCDETLLKVIKQDIEFKKKAVAEYRRLKSKYGQVTNTKIADADEAGQDCGNHSKSPAIGDVSVWIEEWSKNSGEAGSGSPQTVGRVGLDPDAICVVRDPTSGALNVEDLGSCNYSIDWIVSGCTGRYECLNELCRKHEQGHIEDYRRARGRRLETRFVDRPEVPGLHQGEQPVPKRCRLDSFSRKSTRTHGTLTNWSDCGRYLKPNADRRPVRNVADPSWPVNSICAKGSIPTPNPREQQERNCTCATPSGSTKS